jgi:hypothetical protein
VEIYKGLPGIETYDVLSISTPTTPNEADIFPSSLVSSGVLVDRNDSQDIDDVRNQETLLQNEVVFQLIKKSHELAQKRALSDTDERHRKRRKKEEQSTKPSMLSICKSVAWYISFIAISGYAAFKLWYGLAMTNLSRFVLHYIQ